ncbi:hypothetical protein [Neptuniibacter sp. QD37_11]|uniref:hypothetical protein n=1 Tax=Neptuniibacter sp. QD37_11 TaxID=3398209 RepID=UPI0039F4AAC0
MSNSSIQPVFDLKYFSPSKIVSNKILFEEIKLTQLDEWTLFTHKLPQIHQKTIALCEEAGLETTLSAILTCNKQSISESDKSNSISLYRIAKLQYYLLNNIKVTKREIYGHVLTGRLVESQTLRERLKRQSSPKTGSELSTESSKPALPMRIIDNHLSSLIVKVTTRIKHQDFKIFRDRYGLDGLPPVSCTQLADQYGSSRTKISHLMKALLESCVRKVKIPSNEIWRSIEVNFTSTYIDLFPTTAKHFHNQKAFDNFLFQITGQGTYPAKAKKMLPYKVKLNSIFSEHGNHLKPNAFAAKLNETIGTDTYDTRYIQWLINKGVLCLRNGNTHPVSMPLIPTVAFVLHDYKDGLSSEDLYNIIQKDVEFKVNSGTALKSVESFRQQLYNANSFNHYYCSKGLNKHCRFNTLLGKEAFICKAIKQHIQRSSRSLMFLDFIADDLRDTLSNACYQDLRQIVRLHAERFGLYFQSRSWVDYIGTEPLPTYTSQANILFDVIRNSTKPVPESKLRTHMRPSTNGTLMNYISDLVNSGLIAKSEHGYQLPPTNKEKRK